MQTLQPTLFLDGLVFPEGPRWREGKLWFADIWANKVRTVDEKGRSQVVAELERPSGLGFLPDGALLISTMGTKQLLRWDKGGLKQVADLSRFAKQGLNDMVVDGKGRAYVDAYNPGHELPVGSIILVTPDGQAREVASGLAVPNGLVVTPDGKTLLVSQLGGDVITAFSIQPDGGLRNPRPFAKLDGKPDGICLDAEGALWIGQYEKARFIRVREGGEITHQVSIPGKWNVAPMLGGADRKTLFLCACETTLEDLIQHGKSKGSIYTVRVDVPGAGWP